jgi:hypothetical protein
LNYCKNKNNVDAHYDERELNGYFALRGLTGGIQHDGEIIDLDRSCSNAARGDCVVSGEAQEMTVDAAHYTALFRARMDPMAMRELYVGQSGEILADEDRPDAQLIDELRSLHTAYCVVYDEWFALTNRRGS